MEQDNPIDNFQATPTEAEIADQQKLLTAYRSTLSVYLIQRATMGSVHTPPATVSGITDARNEIRRIKAVLEAWGLPVANYPDDKEKNWKQRDKAPSTTILIISILSGASLIFVAVALASVTYFMSRINQSVNPTPQPSPINSVTGIQYTSSTTSRGDADAAPLEVQDASSTPNTTEMRDWTVSFIKVLDPGAWSTGEHYYSILVQCPQPYGTFEGGAKFIVSNDAELNAHTLYVRPKGIFDEQFLGEQLREINPSQKTIVSFTLIGLTDTEAQRRSLDCKAFVELDEQPHIMLKPEIIKPFINRGDRGPGFILP